MGMIELESGRFGCYIIRLQGTRHTVLVQRDLDFPSAASTFGWSPSTVNDECPIGCHGTDGTVDCPDCGTTAGQYIESAIQYLDSIADGPMAVEDPGYFD